MVCKNKRKSVKLVIEGNVQYTEGSSFTYFMAFSLQAHIKDSQDQIVGKYRWDIA